MCIRSGCGTCCGSSSVIVMSVSSHSQESSGGGATGPAGTGLIWWRSTRPGSRKLPGTCRQIRGTLVPAWQCLQGYCSAFRAEGNTLNKFTICDFGTDASFHTLTQLSSKQGKERGKITFEKLVAIERCVLYQYKVFPHPFKRISSGCAAAIHSK